MFGRKFGRLLLSVATWIVYLPAFGLGLAASVIVLTVVWLATTLWLGLSKGWTTLNALPDRHHRS